MHLRKNQGRAPSRRPARSLTEEQYAKQVSNRANYYDEAEVYGPYLDDLRSSDIFRLAGKSFNEHDAYYVGSLLEQFEMFCEDVLMEQGSISDLGSLPVVAYDVITASYGLGIAPITVSHQFLDEETGNVYFKDLMFNQARNGTTAGAAFMKADEGLADDFHSKLAGYSASLLANQTSGVSTASGNLGAYAVPTSANLRKGRVKIHIAGLALNFSDDGEGNLVGSAGGGTVNYVTGAVVLNLTADPAATHAITWSAEIDMEKLDEIPKVDTSYRTKQVTADINAIGTTVGLLKQYQMRRRFGSLIDQENATELTQLMAAISSYRAIEALKASLAANTGLVGKTFVRTNANAGTIEEIRYKQGLMSRIRSANLDMKRRSGDGFINRIVCGMNMADFIQDLDGFKPAGMSEEYGPSILGVLDDSIVVIYAPGQIGDDQALCAYNSPKSPFKSAGYKASYMGLLITDLTSYGKNSLQKQRDAAEWAGYGGLVPRYTHKVDLTGA